MPTYTYRCKLCGHELDIQHPMTCEQTCVCPTCRPRIEMERIITSANPFLLRGAGWYKSAHSHHH